MNNVFDLIAVGNATVDLFLTIHDENKHFHLNEEKELCVKYADKILVDNAKFLLGGNACNVAVGLKRLGFKTAIVAEIGQDEFSKKIMNGLKKEEVDDSLIIKSNNEISPFSIILNYKKERTIFSENTEKDHDFDFKDFSSNFIYLTSLGKKWMDAYDKTLDFAKRKNAKIIFNPGTPQIDAGENHISKILENTDILIVNKEEAEKIVNTDKEAMKDLLRRLKEHGPRIVAITDGLNGAYCIDENEQIYYQPITEAEIVERTGAGDSFSSGFVAALMHKKTIKEAMHWGSHNAASVVRKVGAQQGLLKKLEMEELLK